MIPFLDVLDRAHNGPICDQKDWNVRIIPSKVTEKLKEHGLESTCNIENPINTDDGLADEFWMAGFELAVELGMLCLDTGRIIKFSGKELSDFISETPKELTFGKEADERTLKYRKPEDTKVPLYRSGFGTVGEEIYIKLLKSIAENQIIDFISPFAPDTIYGRKPKAGTPYETLGGHYEAKLAREALVQAGRPNAPIVGLATSPTEYGQLGGYRTPEGLDPEKDIGLVLPITELKTSYGLLHKVALMAVNCKGNIFGSHWSMIGGYVGRAEGAVLTAIASTLLQIPVHQCPIPAGVILDIRYGGNSGRDAIWAGSVGHQAVSRNTNLIIAGLTSQVFGPCTWEMLYEMAVGSINDAVSGCAWQAGNRPSGGRYPNHITPLDQKFGAEVLKSCKSLKREDANGIIKSILPKYEERLKTPDKGKGFNECYDLKTLSPSREWADIYDKVWSELEDLGIHNMFK